MFNIFFQFCTIFSAGYLLLCAGLLIFQRKLIYFPQERAMVSESNTQSLPIQEGKLILTVRARSGPNAVIYFGGNGEDVSINLPDLAQAFPDQAIYLMHYRGFGGSSGSANEAALHADALSLYQYAQAQHSNITIIGRSLGTGIAIRLASQRPTTRLILVTPYDSLQELAIEQFPYVPVRWLLQDKFESWRYASAVTAPTTILRAELDEVIPAASTLKLLARFQQGIANRTVITPASHNSILTSRTYIPALPSSTMHAKSDSTQ